MDKKGETGSITEDSIWIFWILYYFADEFVHNSFDFFWSQWHLIAYLALTC